MNNIGFSAQVKEAKAFLAKRLAEGDVVTINTEMESHDIPNELSSKDMWEVFLDYRPHRETLKFGPTKCRYNLLLKLWITQVKFVTLL